MASPSDTREERERLEQIVAELNRTWASTLSLEIELVRWETHAYPGFNTDPQATINEEIRDDFEIFIGLLWARVGTPTPRATSGTLEEFERAYARFKTNPESISLLFYFKEQPISPSAIKPDDVDQIQKFRNGLGGLGGLYWTFQTTAEFEALVRPHLARIIQVWKGRIEAPDDRALGNPTVGLSPGLQDSGRTDIDDETEIAELGYLDYMDIGESANSVMMAALARMTSAMDELGQNARKGAAQVDEATASRSLSAAKTVANDAATALESFAKQTAAEIPVFAEAYADVLRAFSGAASISVESQGEQEHVVKALVEVEQLRAALEGTKETLVSFAASVRSTPRMTSRLNRARHKVLKVLTSLDAELGKARSNSLMVETSIRNLVDVSPM